MCEPTTIMMAVAAVGTVIQGYQSHQQGKFQKGVAEYNARQTENEAIQAQNVATSRENQVRERAAQIKSMQRAQGAANGVDVDSGSLLNLQNDTEMMADLDAMQIRTNTNNQIGSMLDSASLTRAQGRNAQRQGINQAGSSVLTAAGYGYQAAGGVNSKWYNKNSAANTMKSAGGLTYDMTP